MTKGAPGDAMANVNVAMKCEHNTPAKLAKDLSTIDWILQNTELKDSEMIYDSNGKWKNVTQKH